MRLDNDNTFYLANRLASDDRAKREAAEAQIDAAGADTNDVLFHGAKRALAWVRSGYYTSLFTGLHGVLLVSVGIFDKRFQSLWFLFIVGACGFAYLVYQIVLSVGQVKKRFRLITLELEQRGDSRAVELLFDAWVPDTTSQAARKDESIIAVETALRRVLLLTIAQTRLPLGAEQMSRVRTILHFLFSKPRRGRNSPIASDFSEGCSDILVTLVQRLARSTEASDLVWVTQVAAFPASLPNRILVREAARDCLEARENDTHKSAGTVVVSPLPTVTTVAPIAPVAIQKIGRP